MRQLRTAVAILALLTTPAILVGQRGPEPQQGTGQNNPDMERGTPPSGKSEQPGTSGASQEPGTGPSTPDTKQTHRDASKSKHKQHGGSHDQAAPQL